MKFLELAQQRFSARSYTAEPISDQDLHYLIEAARTAPSAVNFQPWRFLVIRSAEQREKLHACYSREWFKQAPLYIVVCADKATAWVRKSDCKSHADIDAAIAAEHICLAATDLGLGSCWVCNFDPDLFRQHFPLASDMYPVVILPIGHINESPTQRTSRKPTDEIVTVL